MAARKQEKIATLTLLTRMLEFSDTGEIGLLIDAGSAALREATIGKGSILSGKEPAFAFGTLRANDLIWRYSTPGLAWGYFSKTTWSAFPDNAPPCNHPGRLSSLV